jgi:AdoMet-dependent heme synthase
MSGTMKLMHCRANLMGLKRLSGLPRSKKMRYIVNAAVGELLRVRTFGCLGLRLVEISLTDRCQCRCRHCFAATDQPCRSRDELSTHHVKSVLDDMASMGVTEVCFSGGEPLLRDDILDLVQYARAQGLVVRLITNGLLLSERVITDLKQAGLNWCSVSIDSAKPEEHDVFRGVPGCFDKAVNGITSLVDQGLACNIVTVARKSMIDSGALEAVVRLGQTLGVTAVRINFPVPIGRYENQQTQVLTREEREEVRKLLRYGIVSMEAPREGTRCTAGVTKINILPTGDVTPCVFVPLAYGNIRHQKLRDIWQAMVHYNRQYVIKGQCPMCDPCMREKLFNEAALKAGA